MLSRWGQSLWRRRQGPRSSLAGNESGAPCVERSQVRASVPRSEDPPWTRNAGFARTERLRQYRRQPDHERQRNQAIRFSARASLTGTASATASSPVGI